MNPHWEEIGVCSKSVVVPDACKKIEWWSFRITAAYLPRDKILVARNAAPIPQLWPWFIPERSDAAIVTPLKIKGTSKVSDNLLCFEAL
jgi:hypothetical protein